MIMVFVAVVVLVVLVLRGCLAVISIEFCELKTLRNTVVSLSNSSNVVGSVVGGSLVSQSLAMCSIFLSHNSCSCFSSVGLTSKPELGWKWNGVGNRCTVQLVSSSRHQWLYAPIFLPVENVSFSYTLLAIRYRFSSLCSVCKL